MGIEAGLILLAAGTAASTVEERRAGKKSLRAQRERQRLEDRRQRLRLARERRQQVVAARRARAELLATSDTAGTTSTSRTTSIGGNIRSAAASNLAFIDRDASLVRDIGVQNQTIASAQYDAQRAGIFREVGNFAFLAGQEGVFSKKGTE